MKTRKLLIRVRPSASAVERVLWLATLDRALRASDKDSIEVRRAYGTLRSLIDGYGPSLYAQVPIDDARESRWILAVRASLPPGTESQRAAVALWAAIGAWTDAPMGRWDALADAAADLGDALDSTTEILACSTVMRVTMAERLGLNDD